MKILVMAAAGIGDTLIATPFIHELRANFPDAIIDAFVLWPGSRDLLEGNPYINSVHQKNLIKAGAWESLRYIGQLRRIGYDISINVHTQGRIHYRVVARLIGAPIRLSHQYDHHGWLDRWLVNRTAPEDYTVHSVENNNRLLSLLGKTPVLPKHELEVFLNPEEKQWAADWANRYLPADKVCLGVHVGSGGTKNLALKRWPLDHFVALFKWLNEAHPNLRIVLFGGPEESAAHVRIAKEIPSSSILIPETKNLRQAAALMKHCHLFLSVDTALMHLAAAMKVPEQIVIEAPTLNPTNRPYQNKFVVVRNPVVNGRNLEYYRYDGGPIRGTDEELLRCMASITVDDVYTAVLKAMPSASSQ